MAGLHKVKTAVIGCGMISDIYLSNMSSMFSIFNLAGVCNRSPQKAKQKAVKYKLPVLSYQDILKDSSIELVVNLTAPEAHYSVIRDMLNAGKHVYTEKVLAVGYEEAKELVSLAKSKSLYLGAAPDTFLGAAIQTAKQLLDSGMIGQVSSCLAVLNRDNAFLREFIPFLSRPGGGIGFDVGIYYVTALISLLGPVAEVTGYVKPNKQIQIYKSVKSPVFGEAYEVSNEAVMAGTLVFNSGVIGSLHFNSQSIAEEQTQLVIMGTDGILYIPDPNQFGGEVMLLRRGQTEPCVIPHNFGFSGNSRGLGAAELAWSLRKSRSHRAACDMALHALEILHGIEQSSRIKSTYTLESSFVKPSILPQGYLDKYGNAEAALAE
jgi:predicted dehydrogenase